MSKSNATHVQKHPRFFWEFLEHFKFFDFDQAIARKNNDSETPKAPRLTQNWLSSTKLAITSEILGILSPNFHHLYLQKPALPPFHFWRSKLNRLKLEQLTGMVPFRKFVLIWGTELMEFSFLPSSPLFSLTNLDRVEEI